MKMTTLWRHYRNFHTPALSWQPRECPEIFRVYYGRYPGFPQPDSDAIRVGRNGMTLGIGSLREVDFVFRPLRLMIMISDS